MTLKDQYIILFHEGSKLKALTLYTDLAYNNNGGICNKAGNSLNAVEHKPVPTRVLNPNVSKASYKLKQHSY